MKYNCDRYETVKVVDRGLVEECLLIIIAIDKYIYIKIVKYTVHEFQSKSSL